MDYNLDTLLDNLIFFNSTGYKALYDDLSRRFRPSKQNSHF